jgi:hypothetical protein
MERSGLMKWQFIILVVIVLSHSLCFAESVWTKFNGIWVFGGSCSEPGYANYRSEGLILGINERFASLSGPPEEFRQSGKYLIAKWPLRENKQTVNYNWIEGDTLNITYNRFDPQNLPELINLPKQPPPEWSKGEFKRCQQIGSDIAFIHAEGISFMRSYESIASVCQNGISEKCLRDLFLFVDVSKDLRLSKAEISRLIRILSYVARLSDRKFHKTEEVVGFVSIMSFLGPFVATSIIDGSDYDGDGQLSLNELLIDRELVGTKQALDKLSVDVILSTVGKLFKGLDSAVKLLN